jgi:hypothetical protein
MEPSGLCPMAPRVCTVLIAKGCGTEFVLLVRAGNLMNWQLFRHVGTVVLISEKSVIVVMFIQPIRMGVVIAVAAG